MERLFYASSHCRLFLQTSLESLFLRKLYLESVIRRCRFITAGVAWMRATGSGADMKVFVLVSLVCLVSVTWTECCFRIITCPSYTNERDSHSVFLKIFVLQIIVCFPLISPTSPPPTPHTSSPHHVFPRHHLSPLRWIGQEGVSRGALVPLDLTQMFPLIL